VPKAGIDELDHPHLQVGHKSIAELTTLRIGTQRLCLKERGKFVGPSFLVIRISLKPTLQLSLDSLLRFRPPDRGPVRQRRGRPRPPCRHSRV